MNELVKNNKVKSQQEKLPNTEIAGNKEDLCPYSKSERC